MFKLSENYEVDWRILKSDYIRCSPAERSTKNTLSSQVNMNILSEDSVLSLLNSYLDFNLKVIKKLIIPDMETVMIYD